MLFSCAATNRPALGDGVSISPGLKSLKQRLIRTVQQAEFWAPLAVGAALQVDNLDNRLADRLRRKTPLFGSTNQAIESSDDLRDLTKLGYISTAIAAPVNSRNSWMSTKSKLLITEWAGVETTGLLTGNLKSATARERPDHSNNRSFPSGHTSKATIQAQMAILNSTYLPLSEHGIKTLNTGFNSLAIGTAWARVEAGKHHPSDVLAGWSLGYLVSEITRVFIEGNQPQALISAHYSTGEWQLLYRQLF